MMSRAALYSGLLHLAVILIAYFGLPSLFGGEPVVVRAISVEVVEEIAEERAAPRIAPEPEPEPEPVEEAAVPPDPPAVEPPPPAPEPPPVSTEAPPPPEPKETPPEAPTAPELKKPEPKQAEAKPEPVTKPPQMKPRLKPKLEAKKPEEKKKEVDFDKVLRSVADNKPAPREQEKTSESEKVQRTASASQFAERLTATELDAVRAQIEQCWNVPIGARDVENVVVQIRVLMNRDRTVRRAEVIDFQGRYHSDGFYRAVADSAYRAVLNPNCTPLKLPPDKYETWKEITLNFNPRDMF